ncbi:DUF6777 domain-containing protein [Streptomyces sp. NPDC059009]|uniref:DUF6777 domain-containing protein n=1 Tax=Streptomyces sp. NPDC059009 TaxID=3346694 RepID=UPI00368F68B2
MRTPTRTYAAAFAISMALAVAGCSSGGSKDAASTASSGEELFLQPVAAQGPDPFTDSTATSTATPSPVVTRSPEPAPTGSSSPTAQGLRSIQGGTPGLYGGTHNIGSCDVGQQIRFLTSDQAKGRAFAQASGIAQADIASFLRGLTPVVLRADTRVTNHGFRSGQATSFQSVLQAGTAVLVDERGMPRVRCACGNPLKPPVALKGSPHHVGPQWNGYRQGQVVIVTPAPQPITNITIINIINNTWIERKIGDEDANRDRVVPKPKPKPSPPTPDPSSPSPDPDSSSPDPDDTSPSPDEESPSPDDTSSSPDEDDSTSPSPATTDCPSPDPDNPGQFLDSPSPWPSGCPSPSTSSQEPPPPVPPQPPNPEPVVPDQPDTQDQPNQPDQPDQPGQSDGGGDAGVFES